MYNAGWNGNTAVREPDVGKPSSAVVVPPVQHPPYPLPQHPPFMPYAFYSQPLMGAAGMPNPSAGSISVGPNTEFAPVVNGDSEGVQTKRSPRHCCKCGSKEREGTRSAEMPAKIAASRNVGGGIVGDRTRSAQKVGFEICCISFIVLLSTWFSPAFDLLYVIVILYDSMTTCLSIVYHL